MTKNFAFFISGDGIFFNFLIANSEIFNKISIALVIFDQESSAYRSRKEAFGDKCFYIDYSRGSEFANDKILELTIEKKIDYLFTTFDKIIGPRIVDAFKEKSFNLHLSLLPSHPGLHAAQKSLESNDSQYGASFHKLATAVDEGEILAQVILSKKDEASYLEKRLNLLKHAQILYLDMIYKILSDIPISQTNNRPYSSPLAIDINKLNC